VNLVPAFVGVGLPTYVITTFFGILPGSAVYSLSGAGLGTFSIAGRSFGRIGVYADIIAALVGFPHYPPRARGALAL